MILKTLKSEINTDHLTSYIEKSVVSKNIVPVWVWVVVAIFLTPLVLALFLCKKDFTEIEVLFTNGEIRTFLLDNTNITALRLKFKN